MANLRGLGQMSSKEYGDERRQKLQDEMLDETLRDKKRERKRLARLRYNEKPDFDPEDRNV